MTKAQYNGLCLNMFIIAFVISGKTAFFLLAFMYCYITVLELRKEKTGE